MNHQSENGLAGLVTIGVVFLFVGCAAFFASAPQKPGQGAATGQVSSDLVARFAPRGPDPALVALANAARKYEIDPVLFLAISRFETARTFSPNIGPRSSSARGLCQMIRSTRVRYKIRLAKYTRKGPYISHLIAEARKQADACARFTRDQIAAKRSCEPRLTARLKL